MKLTILSARWSDVFQKGVELQTAEAGSVMLDLSLSIKDPRRHSPEVRDAFSAWIKAGNVPSNFSPPEPSAPSRDPLAEIDVLKARNTKLEAALKKAGLAID